MHHGRTIIAVLAAALLSACVSSGIIPVGSTAPLQPLPPAADVFIYLSEKEIAIPFKVLAIVTYSNPGKYQVLSLADAIPELKAQARKAGANGLIIDESHVIRSGIVSTGIGVSARAIQLVR